MSPSFDVAVVGLGAVGSAAAYSTARAGLRVVGFDRYAPPHALGSTHGGSRIIRRAYFEGDVYLPLLERAYARWNELESEMNVKLLHLHGALTIAPRRSRVLGGALETAHQAGISHTVLDPSDVASAYPAFRMRDDEVALFEEDAGWIEPETAVRAHLLGAQRHGAEVHLEAPVLSWRADGSGVRLKTVESTYSAGAVILCSGGWMRSLLPELELPLTLERQVNVWYRPARRAPVHRPDRCPVYVWAYSTAGGRASRSSAEPRVDMRGEAVGAARGSFSTDEEHVLYGFPDAGGGVKAGLHHSGEPSRLPSDVDRDVRATDVSRLTNSLQHLLPDACGAVVRSATCFYTNTPDERFIIDVHPEHDNVVIVSACSGHGFKMSCAVGENAARLASREEPTVNLEPYRAGRHI